ncbi:hypothetical protein [Absidia glauca]|uniref:EamA domain-containing protein n=1 Tax=Absidia glauca TaxID=4829 RepID=A0A163M9U0_ABSGL|nr:hypothetical protein [Absidia glauca]
MVPGYFDKLWIFPLCLGQLVSLCITGTSSASSALWQRHHINIPFTQNACMYLMLALIYGPWHHYTNRKAATASLSNAERQLTPSSTRSLPTYSTFLVLLFSVVDVQANVLAVIAFKNTSVLSALIISSWTLPCIMLLSTFLLKTVYHRIHFMAVGLGLIGLFLLIWGDTMTTTNGDLSPISNHSWWGDLVCLISATLYAVSNVTEEYLVHHFNTQDFLYRIGLAGMVQSGTLALCFEYDALTSITWSRYNVPLVLLYVICLFSMYSLIPMIYRLCGATFVSMSLMTSNFYSLLIGLLFLEAKMPPLYPLAYFLVIVGATLYNMSRPPVYHQPYHQPLQTQRSNHEYQTFDRGNSSSIDQPTHPPSQRS